MEQLLFPEVVLLNILQRMENPVDKLNILQAIPALGQLMHWTEEDLEFENHMLHCIQIRFIDWTFADADDLLRDCKVSTYRCKFIKQQYYKYLTETFYKLYEVIEDSVVQYIDSTTLHPECFWVPLKHISDHQIIQHRRSKDVPLLFGLSVATPLRSLSADRKTFFENYGCDVWNCRLEIRELTNFGLQSIWNCLHVMQNLRCLTLYLFADEISRSTDDMILLGSPMPQLKHLEVLKIEGRLKLNGMQRSKQLVDKFVYEYGKSLKCITWRVRLDFNYSVSDLPLTHFSRCVNLKSVSICTLKGLNIVQYISSMVSQIHIENFEYFGQQMVPNLSLTFYEVLNVVNCNWHATLKSLKIKLEAAPNVPSDGMLGPYFLVRDTLFSKLSSVRIEISCNIYDRDKRRDMDWDFLLLFPKLRRLQVIGDFRAFRNGTVELPSNPVDIPQANIWAFLPELNSICYNTGEISGTVNRSEL